MAKSTRDEWAKRVERWKDSGLTSREYAAEVGVNVNTLQHWGWKLKTEAARPSSAPQKRPRAKTRVRKRVTFVELAAESPSASPFELVVGKVVVRIPASFDAEALDRLLSVAESRV
jgi:hypothetical protein